MKNIKAVYIHGFGSSYDMHSEKIVELSTIADVYGISVDWSCPNDALNEILEFAKKIRPDVVIGTSLGGWAASHIAKSICVPFVAINPCHEPSKMLKKYLGTHIDHLGREFTLQESDITYLEDLYEDGRGLILLDMGDDVIDSKTTLYKYIKTYDVHSFKGGSHRFKHMKESLRLIQTHINTSDSIYGSQV